MTDISRKILLASAKNGRIPNAYFFTGTILKCLLDEALNFVGVLKCERADQQVCGQCSSCIKLGKGIDPDTLLLKSSGKSIKIDDIRQITDFVKYGPASSNWKVVIIEAVDLMTEEAANAFLKTLEEPHKNVLFILTTVRENKVLKTIVSRCQKLAFLSGEPEIDENVKNIADKFINAPKTDMASLLMFSDELSSMDDLDRVLNLSVYEIRKRAENGLGSALLPIKSIFMALRALERKANKRLALDNMFLTMKGEAYN